MSAKTSKVSITGKSDLPRVAFAAIAEAVLGKAYELSVVAATPRMAQTLNKKYRGKDYVPDVLAFPLGKNEGEIILNKSALKREAPKHGLTVPQFAAYIFMHACIHLSGHKHGAAMNKKEATLAKKLGIVMPK